MGDIMKEEKYFCDICKKEICGLGMSLKAVKALSDIECEKAIIVDPENAIKEHHLCLGCYDRIFIQPSNADIYIGGEKVKE